MRKTLVLCLCMFMALTSARAQERHHEIGLIGGVANFYGDLQHDLFPNYGYKPMAGIIYKFFFTPRIGIRLGGTYASVTAADSLSSSNSVKARNLRFASRIAEIHAGLEFNFLPVDVGRAKVSPYIFGGVGSFYYNPYTDGPNFERVDLRPLSTEGQGLDLYPDRKTYSSFALCLPFGGGLKFLLGDVLMITTELGFRYTTTDYLDDVSRSYVNLDTLRQYKSLQAAELSFRGDESYNYNGYYYPNYKYQRGDSKSNDWYWFGGINVAIYFDAFGNMSRYNKTRCPSF